MGTIRGARTVLRGCEGAAFLSIEPRRYVPVKEDALYGSGAGSAREERSTTAMPDPLVPVIAIRTLSSPSPTSAS